jgi:hypothetical protein
VLTDGSTLLLGCLEQGSSSPEEHFYKVTGIYTEGYYQLAIYALIAGLLLIVVSPRKLGSQINTNINQILLYTTTTTDAHLNKIFFGHPVGLFIFHTEMWRRFHMG